VKDTLVFQSLLRGTTEVAQLESNYPFSEQEIFNQTGYPIMHFVEHQYSNDQTNWWIPNRACVEAMLRSSGFEIINRPEDEVYLCKRVRNHD
jgi:tRNA (mo5U34)-methyltransferase